MRNSGCVIAQVINGKGPKLAEVMELSESRVYEILSTDNPYPKAKRLIRAIAQIADVSLIKADLDAMFAGLAIARPACLNALHREASEAVQSVLDGKPVSEQAKELRELIAEASTHLESLENGHIPTIDVREIGKQKVKEYRGK